MRWPTSSPLESSCGSWSLERTPAVASCVISGAALFSLPFLLSTIPSRHYSFTSLSSSSVCLLRPEEASKAIRQTLGQYAYHTESPSFLQGSWHVCQRWLGLATWLETTTHSDLVSLPTTQDLGFTDQRNCSSHGLDVWKRRTCPALSGSISFHFAISLCEGGACGFSSGHSASSQGLLSICNFWELRCGVLPGWVRSAQRKCGS